MQSNKIKLDWLFLICGLLVRNSHTGREEGNLFVRDCFARKIPSECGRIGFYKKETFFCMRLQTVCKYHVLCNMTFKRWVKWWGWNSLLMKPKQMQPHQRETASVAPQLFCISSCTVQFPLWSSLCASLPLFSKLVWTHILQCTESFTPSALSIALHFVSPSLTSTCCHATHSES